MAQGLFKFCVSTIIDKKEIRRFLAQGNGHFTENKAWKMAKTLFLESQQIGTRMPLILSDAAHDSEKLLCWATLLKIELDGDKTMVEFDAVKTIPGKRGRTDLTLRSTGRPIAPMFIKPYAICVTPDFLE
jgi:hypothetical protein